MSFILRNLTFILSLSAVMFFLTQCDGDVLVEAENQLVVEGYIDDGGYPVVMVTLTLPISEEYHSFDEIKDHILRWARVSINDGERTVYLTGRYNKGYFPPYVYTTSDIQGEAGRSYTINVDYRDYHATSTTTIPPKVIPDSIAMRPVEETVNADSRSRRYQGAVYFHDNPATKDYYAVFSRYGVEQRQYLLSQMGVIDDASISEACELPVYRGHRSDIKNYNRYFFEDFVGIKFAHVDSVSYEVLKSYEQNMLLSSNVLLPTSSNIKTNINGGLGYWIGCGAYFSYFYVDNDNAVISVKK